MNLVPVAMSHILDVVPGDLASVNARLTVKYMDRPFYLGCVCKSAMDCSMIFV